MNLITGLHTWPGGRDPGTAAYLADAPHRWDGDQLVIDTPDGEIRPRPGWTLVTWHDGEITVASPRTTHRVYSPHGLAGQLYTVRHTAAHWHQAAIAHGWTVTAHALTCVLAALDGETDPAQLGTDDKEAPVAQYPDHSAIAQKLLDQQSEINRLTTERDGAYRERAQLLAWLAAHHEAVLAPALEIDDADGWHLLYLHAGGHQLSWHIAPRDAELFAHVEHVDFADPRATWDGHTTDEKYERIRTLTADLAQHCGPACSEMHTETGRCQIARNR
ncbi:hypothetical protein [Streptomyces stelliscabiei]|uniref:hypothetical protein n=1 Tax=Streptomyces stelliscabiei TaxID=146820 RepID=UPI0029ABB012|nr:hypothetical protein [Streptomyces stelliscabiei]MDX2667415.1 hypothetical protein [Streptomyces stelliscabiei]MDX2785954.1 hypothetical protein [Streptomyces stelliscabiei]